MAYAQAGQDEGNSNSLTDPSNPNGVLAIAGVLKDQINCRLDEGVPTECQIDTGIDNTNDITGVNQPPLTQVHYELDSVTPYANAAAITARALEVGLPATMVTLSGPGHVNWDGILADDALTKITTSLFNQVTTGAPNPSGCV